MNFSPQTQNNISQPSTNINNINHQYYQQQQAMQYPAYPIGYQNYPYQNMYVQNYPSQNYYPIHSNSENVPEILRKTEKWKNKPLVVMDPREKPVSKISQSKTTSSTESQLSDKSNSLISEPISKNEKENKHNENIEEECSVVTSDSVKIKEETKKEVTENENSKSDDLLLPANFLSLKQSQSIPNKLDNLPDGKFIQRVSSSSETDLYPKSNASYMELEEILNNQRKVYNRDILMEIGKHERSLKLPFSLEKFECKEIILPSFSDSSKLLIHQMYGRLKFQGKIIKIGSSNTGSLSRIVNGYLPPHLRLKEECSINKNLEKCRHEIKSIIKSNDQENVKIEDCIDCLIEENFDKPAIQYQGFKPPTRNRSTFVNSLSAVQNDSYELTPSYGNWAGNIKNNSKRRNADGTKRRKRNQPQSGKQQLHIHNKSSPVRNADESSNKSYKTKYDIFNKDNSYNSESPVRYPSPCESKSEDDTVIMDSDELLDNLLETNSLNMTAWDNQIKPSELITHWLDRVMEKNKRDRNLVGDQLANLVACEKLSKEVLIEGMTQFIDLINDLITDIPKIWTFLAEVIERFIQNSDSYIEFYRNIFECRLPDEQIHECILLILEYANERLGNAIIKEMIDNKLQFLLDFIKTSKDFDLQIQNHKLTFLLNSESSLSDYKFTDSFKLELISRLPNDIENIYELLDSQFTLEETQTDEFVYSLTYCIFSFICELPSENEIIDFLVEKQLFFRRFIDSRSPLETQTLLALVNFANRLEERDLLKTIVQNLTGKTISKEACQNFIHNPEFVSTDLKNNNTNYELIVKAIRSTLENDQR